MGSLKYSEFTGKFQFFDIFVNKNMTANKVKLTSFTSNSLKTKQGIFNAFYSVLNILIERILLS